MKSAGKGKGKQKLLGTSELSALLIVIMLMATGGLVRFTSASYNAQDTNPRNQFATEALGAAQSLAATLAGNDVNLSWSDPSNNSGNTYTVLREDDLSTQKTCSTDSSYANLVTGVATGSNPTYQDNNSLTPLLYQGQWVCYQVQTTYTGNGANWQNQITSPTTTALQYGVVAATVAISNAANTTGCPSGSFGTAGRIDCGDEIVITFNQPVTPTTTLTGGTTGSYDTLCAISGSTTILIGSTTKSGGCATTETTLVGRITTSKAMTNTVRYYVTSYTWSNSNTTLTVLLGAKTGGPKYTTIAGGTTFTFSPESTSAGGASNLKSTTGSVGACVANTGSGATATNCIPTTTGNF